VTMPSALEISRQATLKPVAGIAAGIDIDGYGQVAGLA
jgi:hypothetical protein